MSQELKVNPATRVDQVGRTGIYPASGPLPPGDAVVRGQGELAHPEERTRPARLPQSGSSTALALGRALFGGFFVYNGVNHFLNRGSMTAYAQAKQVPLAGAAVLGTGALLLLGGLSVLTGTRPKVGTAMISTFLLGVTPQMHAFWQVADQQQRMNELVNFAKNIALIGGAAIAAALPEPWPGSVDQWVNSDHSGGLSRVA